MLTTSRTTNPFVFQCPHCGRSWDARGMGTQRRSTLGSGRKVGANTGFVAAAADMHVARCAGRSPAERRAANRRDEQRWAAHPPVACRPRNDPNHPGVRVST